VKRGAQRGDIAKLFGVDLRTVNRWKKVVGFSWIPSPDPMREALPGLWSSALTLQQIADLLGVSDMTVRRWAKDLGLRPRRARSSPSRRQSLLARRQQVRDLVRDGLSDEAVARALDLSRATVASHRRRAGWFYTQPVPIDPAELERLFAEGLSDIQIAKRMRLTAGTVQVARSRLRLLRRPA
jgi:DNA-binding CsgD family transcriptional regulator